MLSHTVINNSNQDYSYTPSSSTTYTLACTGGTNTVYKTVPVTVTQTTATPAPTVTSVTIMSIATNQELVPSNQVTVGTAVYVYVRGTNLLETAKIDFYNANNQLLGSIVNDGTVSNIAVASASSLRFPIAGSSIYNLITGASQFRVVTASGGSSNAVPFTITTPTTPAPTLDFTINGGLSATVDPANFSSGWMALKWTSTYATSCTASGGWTGVKLLNNSTGESKYVSAATTFTLTCTGAGGSATKSVNVVVSPTAYNYNQSQTASVLNALFSAKNALSGNGATFGYEWNNDLQFGSFNIADVGALQIALTKEGVFNGEVTGGFYNQTYGAVQAFQAKYGIPATGFVGPQTRAKLNSLFAK